MIKGWIRKTNRLVTTAFIAMAVGACGGGGGSDDGGGFVPPAAPEGANIDITLSDETSAIITES